MKRSCAAIMSCVLAIGCSQPEASENPARGVARANLTSAATTNTVPPAPQSAITETSAVAPSRAEPESTPPRIERPSSSLCSDERLRLCFRVENGEPPAKVLGIARPDEILTEMRICTGCGSFPRIENTIIPAAEKIDEVLREIRRNHP